MVLSSAAKIGGAKSEQARVMAKEQATKSARSSGPVFVLAISCILLALALGWTVWRAAGCLSFVRGEPPAEYRRTGRAHPGRTRGLT